MKLIEGKTYYVRLKKDDINKRQIPFLIYIIEKKVKNSSILAFYDGKYIKIMDERLKGGVAYNAGYFPKRFIIEEQLEFDF